MLAYMLAAVRFIGFLFLLVTGLFITGIVFPFLGWPLRRCIIRRWSKLLLNMMGIRLVVDSAPPSSEMCGLMVSNHTSWLDIFAADSVRAVRFIAKSDIRDWPVLGVLVTLAGTLYVERGNRHRISQTNNEIREAVESGDLVGFYPEGTTTDGTYLLPFKTNLFQPAIDYGMSIYPVAVTYMQKGQPTQLASYVDDMTFAQSFFSLLQARGVEAHIQYGEPIDGALFADRAQLAAATQERIEKMTGLSVRQPSEDQIARLKGERK